MPFVDAVPSPAAPPVSARPVCADLSLCNVGSLSRRSGCNLAHFLHGRREVPFVKQRGPADESIGSGMSAIGCRLEIHTAIHANVVMQMPPLAPLANLLDLRQ